MSFQNSTPQTPKNQAQTKNLSNFQDSRQTESTQNQISTAPTASSLPSLGSLTELVGAPSPDAELVVAPASGNGTKQSIKSQLKQDLLHAAKELIPDQYRLQRCLSSQIDDKKPVGIDWDEENKKARVSNVFLCGYTFLCPNCGPVEAEKKARLIREDLTVWDIDGKTAASIVLTLQHRDYESLLVVDKRIDKAFKKMMDSRDGRAFKKKWRIEGRQRGPDLTFGQNGWHSHRNFVFYLDRRPLSPKEGGEFKRELTDLWIDYCEKVGGFADEKHGCRVRFDDLFNVADYIASKAVGVNYEKELADRSGWGVAEEMTKSHAKDWTKEGITPTGLLMIYLVDDHPVLSSEEAGRLFQEYAAVFKGKKLVQTSPGFRARLNELKEEHKEELEVALGPEKKRPEFRTIAYLGPKAWAQVVEFEILLWLLDEVREADGDPVKVRDFLLDFEIDQVYYPALDENLPDWWPSETQKLAESVQKQPAPVLAGEVDQVQDPIAAFNEFIKKWNNWEI